MKALLSRKFIFAILVVVMGYILVLLGKVNAQEFFSFAQLIGGIYIVGNIASRVTSK